MSHLNHITFQLYAVLDEALTKAWHWFVEGRAHRAEDVAMAVWACLFNDGQAMAHSDQVSNSTLQLLLGILADHSLHTSSS